MTKIERILLKLPPVAFAHRKSRQIYLPGFQKLPMYDVVTFFYQQIKKVGLNERAAAISFNLIMALPAGLIFLFSIIPYLPESESFETQILSFFKDVSPNSSTYVFIRGILKDLLKKQVGIFSFGFLLLIFYASNALMGIIRTFDKSIQENKVYFLHQRWRAVRLTIFLILLVIASATLLIGQDQLIALLKNVFHMKRKARLFWWNNVRWVVLIAFLFYGIAFIYKFAPSVKKRWPFVTPGSLMATFLTLITTILFSYWINNFATYDKVYGSIGTVLVLMLLIFINSLILLIGFELNVSIFQLLADAEKRRLLEEEKKNLERKN